MSLQLGRNERHLGLSGCYPLLLSALDSFHSILAIRVYQEAGDGVLGIKDNAEKKSDSKNKIRNRKKWPALRIIRSQILEMIQNTLCSAAVGIRRCLTSCVEEYR
jgi:hypothetical protein